MDADLSPAADDDELRTSVAALSQLATGQLGLESLLTRVAELAVSAIPGADGAGLTLLQEGRADTVVTSARFVSEVDAVQYDLAEGPCISATAQGATVRSGHVDADPQWPRFGPRIGALGVRSALSIPLVTGDGVLGALNVYAHQPDAFDERGVRIGELFAVPAALAVENARVLDQAKRLAEQLHGALTNQATIDQAIGILMSRLGCGPDQASDELNQERSHGERLHTVAQRVIDDTLRGRTERRRPTPAPPAGGDLDVHLDYRDAARAVVTVSGALTAVTAAQLTRVLDHQLETGQRYVNLDVSEVSVCDRAGTKALLAAHRAFITARGALVVVGAGAALRQRFQRARIDTVLFLARDRGRRRARWSPPADGP